VRLPTEVDTPETWLETEAGEASGTLEEILADLFEASAGTGDSATFNIPVLARTAERVSAVAVSFEPADVEDRPERIPLPGQ
jgi:hypothetical protein